MLEANKMVDPSPYRRVAVAATFSPRFDDVLCEAKRVRDRFGAELSLIFVGEKTAEVIEKFNSALERLSLPAASTIHYEQGDPATAILRVIEKAAIDLIVAGALEKEVVLHPFLGNVARRLLRESPSSVMLFTSPRRETQPLRKVVFVAEYSEHAAQALRMTLSLAAEENAERVYVTRVITTFDEARAAKKPDQSAEDDEEAKLETFVLGLGKIDAPTEVRSIRGNTGFVAADFVKSVEADLLVIPLDSARNRGRLPPNLEWLSDVIPCNVWVIR